MSSFLDILAELGAPFQTFGAASESNVESGSMSAFCSHGFAVWHNKPLIPQIEFLFMMIDSGADPATDTFGL